MFLFFKNHARTDRRKKKKNQEIGNISRMKSTGFNKIFEKNLEQHMKQVRAL